MEHPPHPALRRHVVTYWAGEHDLSGDGFLVTPDRWIELLFIADPMRVTRGRRRVRLPRCVRIGPLRAPLRLTAPGLVRCAAIRLEPWAAGAILPGRLRRSAWGDAAAGFRARARDIVAAVGRRAWPEVFARFDALLLDLLADVSPRAPGVVLARRLVDGGATTGALARQSRLSRRQAERRVLAATGLPPKQLALLARFQRARDALWRSPSRDLAALARELGYADQAHLSRQFRRFSGQTPRQFAAACLALQRRQQDVAFVQERRRASS